uniref:NADH-ubiquinone oxidoreductase chain 2 n=1 Tax=Calliopsida cinnabarina TaxID=2219944 RepID=A0A3S7MGA4_9HEMI|nr:NADH dehydrogenase subunit 2 [Calliopsida cinnabarina]
MKNNSSSFLFYLFMLMGILISISSNNWLSCWMGIEINLISFLPIMMDSSSIYSSESMISYFIIQSMGSSLLFLSVIIEMKYLIFSEYFTMSSLMIKIGCPPFHMWFPSVMEGLSWMNCFILSTIQKLTPMVLISYLNLNFVLLFVIMACILGSIGGLSYSSLRKIVAYSSIYNLGWIIGGINMLLHSWFTYFLIYSMTLFMVCYLFNLYNLNYLNQFFTLHNGFYSSLMMMVLFMSMGGMPPFLGFFPKMIMVYCFINGSLNVLCLFLLMSALVVLFFYLRVIFTGLLVNSLSLKFIYVENMSLTYVFGVITLFGIIFMFMSKLYL